MESTKEENKQNVNKKENKGQESNRCSKTKQEIEKEREELHQINDKGKKRKQKDPKLLMKAKEKAKTVLKKKTLISKFQA